jgi:Mn-dependent DtxR family transcriptional regulator
MKMTQSQEDYLEMVSFLSEKNSEVRVTDLAAELGFSKPSVTIALKVLEEKNLVSHERYGSVRLTQEGVELARAIREKHKVLKRFLAEILDVSAENAEKDACKMEHALSEESWVKLRAKMREWVG